MAQKYKSKMAVAAIFNFIKAGIYWAIVTLVWPISDSVPNLTEIFSLTTDRPRYRQKSKSKMAAAAIVNLAKSGILGYVTLVWRISICKPNLVQIGPKIAKICLFMYFQDGGRPPSWICFTQMLDSPRRSP